MFDTSSGRMDWTRTLDKGKPFYDISFVDFDLDGTDELMVSTHEGETGGMIYAYEVPSNLQ
jgi:hypothetical protein